MSKGKALVDVLRHTKFDLRINSFVIVKMIGFLSDVLRDNMAWSSYS